MLQRVVPQLHAVLTQVDVLVLGDVRTHLDHGDEEVVHADRLRSEALTVTTHDVSVSTMPELEL